MQIIGISSSWITLLTCVKRRVSASVYSLCVCVLLCLGDVLQRDDSGQRYQAGARTGWQQVWGSHLPADFHIPSWERRYNKCFLFLFVLWFCIQLWATRAVLSVCHSDRLIPRLALFFLPRSPLFPRLSPSLPVCLFLLLPRHLNIWMPPWQLSVSPPFPLFSLSSFSNTLSLCSFFLLILIFSFIRLICMTVNPFAKHPCVKKWLYTFIFSLWRQIWKDQDPFNVCELGTAMWRLASPSMKINAAFQLPRKSDVGTGSDTTAEVSFFQW